MACSARSFRSIRASSERAGRPNRHRDAGFSLIEILIVVAIMGLLVGLVGPNVLSLFQSSRAKTAEMQVEQLRSALDIFLLDVGRYPTESEGLASLIEAGRRIPSWRGPYLRGAKVPMDPWGRPFRYELADGQARVVSLGPDGKGGGDAVAALDH